MTDQPERIVSLHCGYQSPAGDYVDGFIARPVDGKPRPGVVLLSGMYGLAWTQREITRIFARAGFVAISPDYLRGAHPHNARRLRQGLRALLVRRPGPQLRADHPRRRRPRRPARRHGPLLRAHVRVLA